MREVPNDDHVSEAPTDLSKVPEALRALFETLIESDPDAAKPEIEAASRVMSNKDGSVIVRLLSPVKVGDDEHDRIRLRPLKARDYFDGTIADDAQDSSFAATLRFAARIAQPARAVDELSNLADTKAVYFGVLLARGNFSSPKP
jgi:hypothetical protein